jgi:hypothetical protein
MYGDYLPTMDAYSEAPAALGTAASTAAKSIDWGKVVQMLGALQGGSRQSYSQAQQLQPAQLPGSTVPMYQLQIPPLLGKKEYKQTSERDVAQYAKIIAELFGAG